MQTLILAPQTGVFSGQIRTGRRDRRLRIGAPRRSRPHPLIPIPPGAQPRRGNPQLLSNLAQRPAAARQQPHRLRLELIRVLATQCTHQTPSRSQRSLSEVSTISREGQEPVFALMSRLTINRLGARGEGVAQSPDGSIFVPYALAGETVAAEVDGSRGTLVEVLTPSPHRIAPFCRYFSRCGGCAVQTLAADSYARWKRDLVASALRRAGLTNEVSDLADAHAAGRRRAIFH